MYGTEWGQAKNQESTSSRFIIRTSDACVRGERPSVDHQKFGRILMAGSTPTALLPGFTGHLDKIFLRSTHYGSESGSLPMGEFESGPSVRGGAPDLLFLQPLEPFARALQVKKALAEAKVLVIGAGGLGCEVRPG